MTERGGDDLDPLRGIVCGTLLGLVLWAVLVGACAWLSRP